MQNKKLFLKLFVLLAVLASVGEAQAVGELDASTPVRISHPAHDYSQLWATERNPWNADNTKIMMYEGFTKHPSYTSPLPRNGVGLVFGVLADLPVLASGNIVDYEVAVKPIGGPSQNSSTFTPYAVWSAIPGEKDIIYVMKVSDEALYRIDTNIDPIVPVRWVEGLSDSSSLTVPYLLGWTSDNKLLMYNSYDRSAPRLVTEIDVVAKTKTSPNGWPKQCGGSSDINRYPSRVPNEIHGTWSADKSLYFRYSGSTGGNDGACDAVYDSGTCVDTEACYNSGNPGTKAYYDANPTMITHLATWNNEWFIGGNTGDYLAHKTVDSPPYLSGFDIVQVIYDRVTHTFTHRILIEDFMAAGFRQTDKSWSDGDQNYGGGIPSPVLRPDNKQLYFMSTGGKYSYEDRAYCSHFSNVPAICATVNNNANYGMLGIFISDLTLANGDTTPPAVPQGVRVQ